VELLLVPIIGWAQTSQMAMVMVIGGPVAVIRPRPGPFGPIVLRIVEATTGFEPVYAVLQTAPWPLGHVATDRLAAPRGFEPRFTDPKSAVLPARRRGTRSRLRLAEPTGQRNGAEDGTRTRDPHLGKVMLYQLSHFRPVALGAGAEGQIRTDDTRLFRAVLYQLSYLGPSGAGSGYRSPSAPVNSPRRLRHRYWRQPGTRGPGSARQAADGYPTSNSSVPRRP
jgi:hypothetical protein